MLTYFAGLAIVVFVYSLFMACWLEGHSNPSMPRRLIVTQEQQHHAEGKKKTEDVRGDPAEEDQPISPQAKPNVNSNESARQSENHENASSPDRWGTIPERIVAGAALVALCVYGAQAIFMWTANTHAQTEQRAWVEIRSPRILNPPVAGVAMKTSIQLKNLGLTPAHVRTHFVQATPGSKWHGFPENVDLPKNLSPNPMIIPPGAERDVLVYDFSSAFTEEDDKSVLPIMIRFVVTYLDAFGNFRKTVNCYVYSTSNGILSEFTLDDCWKMD